MSLAVGIALVVAFDVLLLGLLAFVMSRPTRLQPHTNPASARRALLRGPHAQDGHDREEQSARERIAA
jgi:hypothetical protein